MTATDLRNILPVSKPEGRCNKMIRDGQKEKDDQEGNEGMLSHTSKCVSKKKVENSCVTRPGEKLDYVSRLFDASNIPPL